MVTDLKPGRYTAQFKLERSGFYPGPWKRTEILADLTHHLIVTGEGRVFETHYECHGASVVEFDPPREWHPSFIEHYELKTDMKLEFEGC